MSSDFNFPTHKKQQTTRTTQNRSISPQEMTSSSSSSSQTLTLIPNLPDDLSSLILSFVPFSHHSRLKRTCRSWRSFFSPNSLLLSLRRLHRRSHLLCIFPEDPSLSPPYLFDPHHLAWRPLPPTPANPYSYGLSNFLSLSLHHHLYLLGGSRFDTRSYPIDRPSPSAATFRLDLFSVSPSSGWDRLSPMISPRGSFACAAVEGSTSKGHILVAGGGSRHAMFSAAGSRMSSVEKYDVEKDKWEALEGLPRFRAGCAGFLVGDGKEMEFWVMGGYGESRTISGVFPMDEYYRDGVVLELKDGGKWREIDNMWEEGERRKLGSVVVVDGVKGEMPRIFMLDGPDIFRYNTYSNRWQKEASVPRKGSIDTTFGFAALDGELYVLSPLKIMDAIKYPKSRAHKRERTLLMQIYDPEKKTWRYLTTKPPFQCSLDFRTAVLSTIRI